MNGSAQNNMGSSNRPQGAGPIRFQPVVLVSGILGLLLLCFALWLIVSERRRAAQGEYWAFQRFGLADAVPARLADKFRDQNNDLLADPPAPEEMITPETLRFSYIPDPRQTDPAMAWGSFMQRLSQAVGVPVEYQVFDNMADQLKALEKGELHVAAFNTGSVPRAVNQCGFIPVAVQANADGDWRITMKLIVNAKSPVNKVSELKGKHIAFTNPRSFSGFKYGIVVLLTEFGMRPGLDYDYRFSTSHEQSIEGVARGDLGAALVASDLLEAARTSGTIQPDQVREIYTSSPFPAAAFGYVYNLSPDLAQKVRDFLVNCDLADTPADSAGAGSAHRRLVATDYKRDWAPVREVDNSIRDRIEPELPIQFPPGADVLATEPMQGEDSAEVTESEETPGVAEPVEAQTVGTDSAEDS